MRGRRRGGRFTRVQVGVMAVVLIAVATFFAFSKDIPFTKPDTVKAVFRNTSALQLGSPVRIAGVEVGKVSKVEPAGSDSTASVVTMKIKKDALPIHKDAEMKIRPRIFLEGNFFVDIRPGTPSSPTLDSGATIPATQTSAPVQLDQVLGVLKSDTRKDLQKLVSGYGTAINGKPSAAADADADPSAQGETAGKSLNDSLQYAPDALRGTAIVNDALQGTELHDLSKLIKGGGKVSAALASREEQLKDLVTNFNTVTGSLASEQGNLRTTIHLLPQVLDALNPSLDSLNAAFPPTRAFAREILPGVRETPASINASLPWIAQTRKLVSQPELKGLVGDLRPAVRDLATFTDGTVRLLPQLDLVNRCLLADILPTGDEVIQDGAQTTGVKNYKEFFQTLVGLSGESQNFDGNGGYTRFQTGGGTQTVSTGSVAGTGPLFGNALRTPLGTRPARPAKRPPYRRDSPCYKQKRPNLDAARLGGGP
jgi:phospholipid/cholesterol/gamma-HCH transport system substrate-binding protein